ncbi:MAG TPA: DNA translocase FtsK 4TM domain-containing protein [Nitrospiraceae bacterium]|nr:DNA translocase FtsK 4TM domain-containing protein [Nitrospiraceae bacterium]
MGGTSTAKRGDARNASRQFSHLRYEVIGVLLITLSLLTLLSLASFTPSDVPLFGSGPSDVASARQTRNMIGTAGATLSVVLFRLVGAAAYLVPFLLAMLGARCFVEGPLTVTVRSAGGSLLSLLFLSSLLQLEVIAVPTLVSGLVYRGMAGGLVGQLISEGLKSAFASTGAHIIVASGLVISLLLATPISLADLRRRVPGWWKSLTEAVAAIAPALPERAERDEKVRRGKPKPVKINRSLLVEDDEEMVAVEASSEPVFTGVSARTSQEPANLEEEEPAAATSKRVSTGYVLPDPRELLSDPSGPLERMTDEELKAQSEILTRALLSFGIEGKITEVHPGPVVTMYEFEPAPGVKVARIVNLDRDLALALKATSLRIVAPIPGKSVVGIEVPNRYRETVSLKEVLTSEAFTRSRSKLTIALGKDIFGVPVTADLKAMPHLLVAGATGAGKSVSLNTMLISMLFSARPNEVKLLLIDPKMLEFQVYDGIPHLLRPVITDPKSAARGLGWVVQEMERRYKLLAEAGVRNVEAYNRRVAKAQGVVQSSAPSDSPEQPELPIQFLSEEARLSAGESMVPDDGPAAPAEPAKTPPEPLPYVVVMIDELADLMAVAPKEVEDKIARLAQMARASGIHLVLATQRPSTEVLTGLIKANFPARIAFQVSSQTDSRVVLDVNGAEALLGKGDMLYLASGTGRITRLHGSFVADDDVRQVVDFIKKQAMPSYGEEFQSLRQEEAAEEWERDEVYEQAKELVLSSGQASASLIQRRLRVGYPRAARMIERMEEEGIVSAPARDGRREVIVRRGPMGGDDV